MQYFATTIRELRPSNISYNRKKRKVLVTGILKVPRPNFYALSSYWANYFFFFYCVGSYLALCKHSRMCAVNYGK